MSAPTPTDAMQALAATFRDATSVPRANAPHPLDRTVADGALRIVANVVVGRVKPAVSVYMPSDASVPQFCESVDLLSANARKRLVDTLPDALRTDADSTLRTMASALAVLPASKANAREAVPLVARAEPWPESVDVGAVLDAVRVAFNRHVVMPDHGDVIASLWTMHTHLVAAFSYTPFLWLSSPTKQCGKTTILELLELLSASPFRASNATVAALFRLIETAQPTLLLDELDTWLTGPRADDIAGILNDGWQRGGQVARCVGDDHDVKAFSVFCPKALAGIGATLADATRSRCILLPMQRANAEQLAGLTSLRTDRAKRWSVPLQQQLARVGIDHADALRERLNDDDSVSMPDGIDGRDAQAWEPLLAVATLAGGQWPTLARAAAVASVRARRANDDADVRMRLLVDIRDHFDEHGTDSATSAQLRETLTADESKGWQECGKARKPITDHQLARWLKPFGLAPVQTRLATGKARVWLRAHFEPVWQRYAPQETFASGDLSGTSGAERGAITADVPLSRFVPLAPLLPSEGELIASDFSGAAPGLEATDWDSLFAQVAPI